MFPSHLPTPRRPAAQSIPILRWGIIGPGWIAERFVHSLKTYSRQQVVAVASRSQAKADRVAAEWGIPQAYGQVEEMLARPDIDAVYIATPHNHHFPDGMQALKAGKHVLIEKPFALNLGEGRELQAEAARQEKLALEAMWCDYAPKYDVIRQLLEDGALGDLHTLLADHGEYFTREHRIYQCRSCRRADDGPRQLCDLVCSDGGRHAAGDCRPRQRHGGGTERSDVDAV
jgi:predicted dehydrogenase